MTTLSRLSIHKKVGKIGKCTTKGCSTGHYKRSVKNAIVKKQTQKTELEKENGKLLNGEGITTHKPDACIGEYCCVHNPSDHHMRTWDRFYRVDKSWLLERLCPKHRIGHPDPDSLSYFKRRGYEYMGVHGCCGCCAKPRKGKSV